MAGIEKKIFEIKKLDYLQQRDQWMNRIHPLVKFSLSVIYVLYVTSIGKYQIQLMIAMALYPFLTFCFADLSLKKAMYRMRLLLVFVMIIGVFNPVFDQTVILYIGGVGICGGVISMLNLMLKAFYSVLAAYVLIATTSIEDICYALRMIHVPKILVTIILLINRYIYILAEEAERIMTAYRLRAPRQKGIHYKVWGSLVGQWLLRSMDRAQIVYEAMVLKGFNGEFTPRRKICFEAKDLVYMLIWISVLGILRFTPVVDMIGSLLLN